MGSSAQMITGISHEGTRVRVKKENMIREIGWIAHNRRKLYNSTLSFPPELYMTEGAFLDVIKVILGQEPTITQANYHTCQPDRALPDCSQTGNSQASSANRSGCRSAKTENEERESAAAQQHSQTASRPGTAGRGPPKSDTRSN